MKDLLSNEEIDTLLQMFRAEGSVPEAEAQGEHSFAGKLSTEGPVVSEVDLLKPNRLSRDQIRNLERLFEGTGKLLGATIAEKLRLDVPCDCVAVEQMRFSSWIHLLGGPVAIYVVKLPPFEQPVLFTATSSLLYSAVDRVLGGTGRVLKVPQEFSVAEFTVADAFVGPCLDRICGSLSDFGKFTWSIEGRFTNPSLAQILPAQDVVLAVHFQTSGDHLLGDLRLLIPYTALEPYLKMLELGPGARFRQTPGALRESLARTVAPVEVELSVILGNTQLPLKQLLRLAPGDVIPLEKRLGESLVAPVQGRPKFIGQVGVQGHRLAFQIGGVLGS